MIRYLIAALAVTVVILGGITFVTGRALINTRASLVTANRVLDEQLAAAVLLSRRLEKMQSAEAIISERTRTTHRTLNETLKNEQNKNWADHPVPPDVARMLNER